MLISQLASNQDALASQITDGRLVCAYKDLISVFDRFDRFFTRILSLNDGDLPAKGLSQLCIALKCENSLPSAVVLLYLLERGCSVVLLSAFQTTVVSDTADPEIVLPQFCYGRISTADAQIDSLDCDPGSFIEFAENRRTDADRASQSISGDDPKLFLRTSGSTGTPKLVMHSLKSVLRNGQNCVERLGLTAQDRVAIPVPIYHMYGLGAGFLPSVLAGASIDLQKGANLLRFLQRERDFAPTAAFMIPSFCETLSRGRRSKRDYRVTVAAGDTMSSDAVLRYEQLMGPLVKLYGSTEMGAIAAASPELPQSVRATAIGQPMPGVQLRILPTEASQAMSAELAADPPGELWCLHGSGFDGYVDDAGNRLALADTDPGGWFRTKDFAYIDENGNLDVFGRCDHSVNRDGRLVFFSEVEKSVKRISPEIVNAAVTATGQTIRGRGLTLYCVLERGSTLTEAAIRTACLEQMERRAVPDSVVLVNALPQLSNGKLDRQKLLKMSDSNVHQMSRPLGKKA